MSHPIPWQDPIDLKSKAVLKPTQGEENKCCEFGLCDGSGIMIESILNKHGGTVDFYEKPCPCSTKVEDKFNDQDPF